MPSSFPTEPEAVGINLSFLRAVGELVYGSFWQKPMALHIGLSQRHMVRWNNGDWPVPDQLPDGRYLLHVLKDLVETHKMQVDRLMNRLIAIMPDEGRPGT
jgi:hypothetical protein